MGAGPKPTASSLSIITQTRSALGGCNCYCVRKRLGAWRVKEPGRITRHLTDLIDGGHVYTTQYTVSGDGEAGPNQWLHGCHPPDVKQRPLAHGNTFTSH